MLKPKTVQDTAIVTMAVHQHPVTYTAWSNKGRVFAIVTSLWRGLVTRQQVLVSTVNTSSVNDHKENKVILNGRLRSFAAFVPTSNSEEQLIKGRLSSFLSLGGATLYYTFDENKLNSYGLDKRQLNCAKYRNVKHKTLKDISPQTTSPRTKTPRQKPPFSLSLQTVSLVQGIVGKQHERQVDYDKWQKPSAGTQGELTSGRSRTSRTWRCSTHNTVWLRQC